MNDKKNEKQKALNLAFYATIVTALISLIAIFLGYAQVSILACIEIIVFPILGYLTKKSNRKAVLFLIILFLFDRVMFVINWTDYIIDRSGNLAIIQPFIISFILWMIYYRAYQYLRSH